MQVKLRTLSIETITNVCLKMRLCLGNSNIDVIRRMNIRDLGLRVSAVFAAHMLPVASPNITTMHCPTVLVTATG